MKRMKEYLERISYRSRREKSLQEYEQKYNFYKNMSEPEFIMDYSAAIARYNETKISFGVSWITTIVVLGLTLYQYVASVKEGLSGASFSAREVETILNISILISVMVFISACIILGIISRNRRKAVRAKIFMEEMRAGRIGTKGLNYGEFKGNS